MEKMLTKVTETFDDERDPPYPRAASGIRFVPETIKLGGSLCHALLTPQHRGWPLLFFEQGKNVELQVAKTSANSRV